MGLKTTSVFLLAFVMVVMADVEIESVVETGAAGPETGAPTAETGAPTAETGAPEAENAANQFSARSSHPCNQFCSGNDATKLACCRAQGYTGYSMCIHGVMHCY